MKGLLFLLSAFFLIVNPARAQENKTDSLKNLLTGAGDIEKISLYLELSDEYLYENNDSALWFASAAVELSEDLDKEDLYLESLFQLGKVYLQMGESKKSLDYFFDARDKIGDDKNQELLVEINNRVAQVYISINELDEAMAFLEESVTIAEELGNDNLKASSLIIMGRVYQRRNETEEALNSFLEALEIRKELEDKPEMAAIYNNIGSLYSSRSDFENAIGYYEKSLEIRRELGNKRGLGIILNNLGNQHLQLGNYEEAIEYYRQASEIFKEIKFDRGTAATLTGMAVIYESLKQYESVLQVYQEVLEIREREDNQLELANTISNIAVTYSRMLNDSLQSIYGSYYLDTIYSKQIKPGIEYGEKSISYNLQALEIRREINDTRGVSITLANLGTVYQSLGEFEKANESFREWLALPQDYQDDDTKVAITIGMGRMALYERDYNRAINYFNEAYNTALSMNKKIYIQEASRNLSDLYEKTGQYKEALEYFQIYHNVYDSLNQETTRRQIHEMQVKYETEAKEKENEILRKDQLIKDTKLKNTRYALIAVVIAVLVFAGLIIQLIRQNNLRRKANEELERKNQLITEQTKEITDSIQYASRIQNAVLPPEDYMKKLLPQQFIIFRPRDIVSGDYYWITRKGDKIITMVADCTGHGVPGAFMSMLGVALLNEIVSKHEKLSTDFILNELRRQVIESLHQTGEEGGTQDGIDVALYIIDIKTLKLEFSGANNPLLIFRDDDMFELKADKMPIGIHTSSDKPFTKKEFQLEKGDMLYAYSDGYPDQFGGPKGKKFMIRRFKKLLQQIHKRTVKEQKKILEKTLDDWMTDTSQIDDILIMGVRV